LQGMTGRPAQGEFNIMMHALLKASAAIALGSVFAAPAFAVSPLPLMDSARLVLQAGDIEDQEVGHDLEPDVTPAPSETEKGEGPAMPREEGSSANTENEEVWRDLRPDVTPPDAVTGE
jgi:hypothetical protein